jgi:hypothetical protein
VSHWSLAGQALPERRDNSVQEYSIWVKNTVAWVRNYKMLSIVRRYCERHGNVEDVIPELNKCCLMKPIIFYVCK